MEWSIPKEFKEESLYTIFFEFSHLMTEFMLTNNIFDLSSVEFMHFKKKMIAFDFEL